MNIDSILQVYNKINNTKLVAVKKSIAVSKFAPGLKSWRVQIINAATNEVEYTIRKTMIQEPQQDFYQFLAPQVLGFLFTR